MQVDLTQLSLFRIGQNEASVSEIKWSPITQLTILSMFLPEVDVGENRIIF
jgi:hypothetical protein